MATKFIRRVQKIKTGSFIVSLPREWVEKNGISAHDPLLVFEDANNNVIIRIPVTSCETEIDASALDVGALAELVKQLYVLGVNKIVVKKSNGAGLSILRDLRKELIGYEIEDFGKDWIVVAIRDDVEAVDEANVRRLMNKYLSFLREIIDSICRLRDGSEVRELIQESKRVARYLQRTLSIAIKEPERNKMPYPVFAAFYEIALRLREIGYYVYRMADFLPGIRKQEALEKMCSLCTRAFDTKDLEELIQLREELNRAEEESLPSLNPYEAHMAFAMRRIMFNMVRIAETLQVARVALSTTCKPTKRI
jgi:phosphate uptake regulator